MTGKRVTRRTKRGGAKLNEGAFGMVYRPALTCIGGKPWNDSYVSKVLPDEEAIAEYQNGMLVKALDPTGLWSVTPVQICEVETEQSSANNYGEGSYTRQIVYPYAGVPLLGLIGTRRFEDLNDPAEFRRLKPEGLSQLIQAVKGFLPRLLELNKTYIHGDCHLDNLLWDDGVVRLIDFASLRRREEVFRFESQKFKKELMGRYRMSEGLAEDLIQELRGWLWDKAGREDVDMLYANLKKILRSSWAKSPVFTGKYKFMVFLDEGKAMTSDIVEFIMSLPVDA